MQKTLRVSLRVLPEELEPARARMLELFPAGIEELDTDAGVELAGYGSERLAQRVLGELQTARSDPVPAGWENSWKAFHRPVRIGRLWVGPPWRQPDPDALAVVVDPGRAFGTGAHPTTRLCLELLEGVEPASLLDLGCGSGVLAIAAAKLGFDPVTAVDLDPLAVEAVGVNAELNGVAVGAWQADVLEAPLPRAGLVVANIALETVERLAARVDADLLLTSGYLEDRRPCLGSWRTLERRTLSGWAADLHAR